MCANVVHLFVPDKRYKNGVRCERYVLGYNYDVQNLRKAILRVRKRASLEYIGWNAFASYIVMYK